MSFLDFTNLVSDEQLSELAALNAERAAEGKELITLLDVMADDTILESTGVTTTSAEAEATLNEMAAINDAAAGLAEVDRFTGEDTNDIIQGLVQENIDAGGTLDVVNLIDTYIDDQANATVDLAGGELDLSDLADYGQGSSPVLAPDGKGIIRGGTYISLDPTQSSMSASEVNELKGFATRNTNLLLAQQEFEENGTPIAETLGLKMPGDDNFDGDDRERIQEAENAAATLLREQSDLDYHRYLERQSDDGPSAIEIHNQIFGGGGNAPGTVKQDENGNWYAVKQIEGTNATGRDYSIDPKDDNKGPTFGGNVSTFVENNFPNEVAAAGGSSDYTGSIKDIFKDTDVDSLGYDAATGTYTPPEPVVETPSDIAQPGDLDLPEVSVEPLEGTPADLVQQAGMDDLSGLDLLAEETGTVEGFTPTADTFNAVNRFMEDDQFTRPSNIYTDDVINRMDDDDDFSEQVATGALTSQEISDLAASALDDVDEEALYGPVEISIAGFTEDGLADEVAKYTGSEDPPGDTSGLSAGTIADGLFKDVLAGGAEEGALRVEGTANMVDDVLNVLSRANIIGGSEAVINPEYADNLAALEDLSGLDRLALETRAAELGVPIAFLLDPTISNETGETIPITISTDPNITVARDSVQGAIDILNNAEAGIIESMDPEYRAAVIAGMPDPNNEGYNIAGDPISPGLWMASLAAQELLGLGLDIATVVTLGPVAGGALTLQQGTAEAGQAAANDVTSELTALREAGALDHLTDEQFQNALNTSSTQAFYTSGPVGGIVDTVTALTAGGFTPLAKILPGVIGSVLKGTTVVGSEGLSGAGEQVGVNAAVIRQLEAAGLDLSKYDRGYLDGIITAAINEAVGGTGAATAVTVSSLVSNLSSDNTGTAQAGQGQENNPNEGPDLISAQGLNTIESNEVTDSNGVVYLVDTAVDANGNTSVTVTNKNTNTSKTTNVSNGNVNVVSVGADTSVFVDSTNTNNSNTVNVSTLTPGSEVTVGGGESLLNGDDDVDIDDDVDVDVDDTEVLKATATDDISSAYDPNTVYRRNNISYLGDPSNGVLADGNINGTVYKDGQVVFGTGEGEGTDDVSDATIGGGESLLNGGDDADTSELTTVYHATKGEPFTQFDPTKGDNYYSNMGAFGPGFYGSLDTTYPSDYVGGEGSLMSAEIDTSNMLDAKNNKELTLNQVNGLVNSLSSRTDSEGNNLNVEWNGGTGNITVSYVRRSSFAGESVADRTVTRVIDTTNPTDVFQNVNLISENIKNPLATDDQGLVLESEQDGDTQNLKSILTDAGFTGVLGVADTGAGQSGDPNSVVVFDESLIGDLNIVIDQDTIPTSKADLTAVGTGTGIPKALMNDDAVAHLNFGTVTQSAVDLVSNPDGYTQQELLDVARQNGIVAGPGTGFLPGEVYAELSDRVNNSNLTVVDNNGQPVFAATGTDDVSGVDVSGTGITGVIQGGATGDGTPTGNLTLVGDSSVSTSGDLTITTVTDANGNATVSTTNNVTGENTITNVSVGDSTSVTNGNSTVNISADTNGTTTQTTDNKVTTDNTTTTDNKVTTVTTVEEPEYKFEDSDVIDPPDVTIPPIDTVFVPETSFTPGGGDDDDDEEPPVGEQDPGYTSGIAGLSGARPTVAPYYQPQQTGQYSFYVPQPGVDQTVPAGPVFSDPMSYLAPTASPQYGYGYIAPNAELEYLRRLAEIQGTGDEKLPSENLMDGS
mgnify:CR=1 FL=1